MNNAKLGKKNYLRVARKALSLLLVLELFTSSASAKESKSNSSDYREGYYISTIENIESYLNRLGIETSRLKCGTLYVKSYTKNKVKNIIVYNNDDFREYLSIKNPTFEDCFKILNSNTKLSDDFKTMIYNYLIKVRECNPNADLSVFYCNLKNLEIECTTKEELSKVGQNVIARFDAKNCKILYLEGISEKTFEHELSHVFTESYLYIDDETLIHKTISLGIPIIEDNKITIKFSLGAALEGITEIFTISNNPNIYKTGSYKKFVEEITGFLELTNENALNVQENGIIYLIDVLYEHGIYNSFELLHEMDEYFDNLLNKSPKLIKSA